MVPIMILVGGVLVLLGLGLPRPRVTLWLAGGAVLLLALIVENLNEAIFDREELFIIGLMLVLLGGSVVLLVRGGQRRQGAIGLGLSLALLVLAVVVPALSASTDLPAQIAGLPTATPGPTQSVNQRARGIFDQVVDIIGEETGLDYDTIARNLDEGVTVATLVRENDGDLEVVIEGISELLTEQVQVLVAEGDMTEALGALTLSQMDVIVRLGVEQDLAGSLERFEDNPLDE